MRISEEVPESLTGERLDRVVSLVAGISRSEASALIEDGAVVVSGTIVTTRTTRLVIGDVVELDLPEHDPAGGLEADASVIVPVVHEDAHLLVIDKPSGVVVHPGAGQRTGTLGARACWRRIPEIAGVGDPTRPGIVHRLDKGTSGLLLVARTQVAYDALVAALSARTVHRRYRAVAWGRVEAARGLIDAPIGRSSREPTLMAIDERGKEARTRYEVLQPLRRAGARHRAGLRAGDRPHPPDPGAPALDRPPRGRRRALRRRAAVSAHGLDRSCTPRCSSWPIPSRATPLRFESPLPADLAELLSRLSVREPS